MLPPAFTTQFLKQLELLRIRSRRAFLGTRQGGHASLKRGHGIEFSDYRKYELGDDPRHIDWSVYARSDRLYIKQFREEQDLSVIFILDATASMFYPEEDAKWQTARDIAIALGYIGLMQQDRVLVSVPGYGHSPVFCGASAIHSLSKMLLGVRQADAKVYSRGIRKALSRIRFPGVAVFLSDFLMPFKELETVFNLLRSKNLDVTAIQVLGPNDINPLEGEDKAVAIDSETGQEVELVLTDEQREDYGYLLGEHNFKLRNFLADAHIPYLLAPSNQSVSDFITGDLAGTGLLQ